MKQFNHYKLLQIFEFPALLWFPGNVHLSKSVARGASFSADVCSSCDGVNFLKLNMHLLMNLCGDSEDNYSSPFTIHMISVTLSSFYVRCKSAWAASHRRCKCCNHASNSFTKDSRAAEKPTTVPPAMTPLVRRGDMQCCHAGMNGERLLVWPVQNYDGAANCDC